MMDLFLLVLLIILVSMAGLAVGIMARRTPLKGSCGGPACDCRGECRTERHSERMNRQ